MKKEPGYRNTFDWSPWFEGKKITAESGCTQYLIETYGEFDSVIIQDGVRSGFEHQGCSLEDYQHGRCDKIRWEDFYLGVDATNSDSNWSGDIYLGAGNREYCVSFKHLAHYTCTPCVMGTDGKVVNCGARHEIQK